MTLRSTQMESPAPPEIRDQGAKTIVVVEDDKESANILDLYLSEAGFDVHVAHDGDAGLALIESTSPDLVVLDLMLPEVDGWTVCRTVRGASDVPILILSARQEENDRLLGLGLGADDYVVKPFSPREIVLRVNAILRRVAVANDEPTSASTLLGDGPIQLDLARRVAVIDAKEISLTPSEFKLLHALMRQPGRTFERSELIDELYPSGGRVVPKVIDVHVGKIRQKIEADPTMPKHLLTIRGFGYRFET